MTPTLLEDEVQQSSPTMTIGGATAVAPPAGGAAPSAAGNPAGRLDMARFELIREVGKGGMATIFLAADNGVSPQRRVALKLMHAHLEGDPSLVRRFEHEVRSQLGLAHPSIVELIGWGRDARGQLFMALEFVDGPALKDLMANGRRFPADIACFVALRMLKGLAEAHARGLVHRDVKPANVMLTLDGQVKVADFGISKSVDMTRLTSTGNVIGTPAYMSPEQALARQVDHRSDLFSVGVTLYEMLAGGNPFQTGNPATTLSRVVHHHQRPVFETLPQTPAILEELIDGLLQKEPEKRLATATAAIEMLERCIRDEDLASTQEAMAAFVREAEATTRRLDQRRGRRCLDAGIQLYAGGKGPAEAAVWQFFLATILDPGSKDARTWLEQVSRERGYNLERKAHPRIDELEASLASEPDSLPVILQLAKLHKSQGNFLQVIFYYKRAKALRPPDNYTKHQIETLVPAHSSTIIDGTGVFETAQGVPVRTRPAPAASVPARQAAEGWGDFVSGVLSTTWGRVAAVAGLAACLAVAGGWAFDRAVDATQQGGGVLAEGPGDVLDTQGEALQHGKSLGEAGSWAAAERQWRQFLAKWPDSPNASEARFRLGDSLERQGRRDEALDVHAENAGAHQDEWALLSHEDRGEMLLVDGDVSGARAEYQAVVEAGSGEQRLRAQLALAGVEHRAGRDAIARQDYEDVVRDSGGMSIHDRARLAFADFCAETGDAARAAALYTEIRDTTDHRGDAFRDATAGLERIASSASLPASDPPPAWPAAAEPESTPVEATESPAWPEEPAGDETAQPVDGGDAEGG